MGRVGNCRDRGAAAVHQGVTLSMSFTIRWAGILAGLTFIAALAGAIVSLPVFEPLAPASRGYVRYLVEIAQAADSAQNLQITTSLLDLKLTALAGQYEALKIQDDMLIARIATAEAGDLPLLRGLEKAIAKQMREKGDEITVTCDQLHAAGSRVACGL